MAAGRLLKPFSEIPGPRSLPILGTMLNYIPPFGEYKMNRLHHSGKLKYQKYGKLVREEIFPGMNYLFVYDPVDIETMYRHEGKYPSRRSHTALEKYRTIDNAGEHNSGGLLPTNGEDWNIVRKLFQKALSHQKVPEFIPSADKIMTEFIEVINDPDIKFGRKDFLTHLLRLNLELVGDVFFGTRLNAFTNISKESLPERLIEAADTLNSLTVKTDNGSQLWRRFDTRAYRKITTSASLLENTGKFFVSQRQASLANSSEKSGCIIDTWLQEEDVDLKDIKTMSADMILAGIDTTAFSISFIMYHLSTNLACQEKLFQELKKLLPKKDSPVDLEVLEQASYLRLVIKESLRMNPISVGIGRILPEETEMGGYLIPAKTVAVSMNQVACRFPEYFDRPDEFVPERWTVENRKLAKIHPFLVLPFGFGPRTCIARRLAEQQIKMFVAKLCRQFQFEWLGAQPLDCVSSNINKPDAPLLFKFTPREE